MALDSPRSASSPSLKVPLPSGASDKAVRIAWPHIVLGVLGLAASVYATHVHALIKAGEETGCGISDTISCDKVIGSPQYGEVFGIPLGIFGALFWAIVLVTAISSRTSPPRAAALQRLLVGAVGLATSIFLAWISLGVLHKFCPVCATTHVLSGFNFLAALGSFWAGRKTQSG